MHRGQDNAARMRRVRLLEMADAMDMFCQGLVCAFTVLRKRIDWLNSWSGESVSEVPPLPFRSRWPRLHAPLTRKRGEQTRYRAAPQSMPTCSVLLVGRHKSP
jgi:hypothetical protein